MMLFADSIDGAPGAMGGMAAPGAEVPTGPGKPRKYPDMVPGFGAVIPARVLPIVAPLGTPAGFGIITPPLGDSGSVRPAWVPVIPINDRGKPVIDGAEPAIYVNRVTAGCWTPSPAPPP